MSACVKIGDPKNSRCPFCFPKQPLKATNNKCTAFWVSTFASRASRNLNAALGGGNVHELPGILVSPRAISRPFRIEGVLPFSWGFGGFALAYEPGVNIEVLSPSIQCWLSNKLRSFVTVSPEGGPACANEIMTEAKQSPASRQQRALLSRSYGNTFWELKMLANICQPSLQKEPTGHTPTL